ncbi:carboxypeptidase M32 [Aureimonas jatrophae]|uniref:Metal-dependent carboxypeptidase n=1 Tax=Aureimonas jatrophae TaxID=1166073 RepID=A0A1H0FHG4_9HYPH|nr:carboxypeptidase M32 [Aureimonas jatrophae]MBB3950014.1 carboxypeptidase Taq [Aureimonas jatrophae]SDN94107.1 carboxypeptidase Taq [Aureimonas jatrophae]
MSYAELLDTMGQVNDLLNAESILKWDARTMMPSGGTETRGKQIATLAVFARDLLVADQTRRLLDGAERETAGAGEDSVERTIVAQVREAVDYHLAIPADLQRRRAELGTIGQRIWAEARARSDFQLFLPVLEETVEINRAMAEAIGYSEHPYDALMHRFEPGETVSTLRPLYARLREVLVPLVSAIARVEPPRFDFLERHYPVEKQHAFALKLAESVGYDLGRGRLDETVHPFEVSFTRNDVRITTRFYPDYMPASLFGALHEAGHGLYEQGVDEAYTRTPLATDLVGLYAVGGVSFGAHESQSRLWENHVGRSRPFWQRHFPQAQATYPEQLGDVSAEEFYRAVNRCRPGLIRVEADELTYDLHIMLRTEIEAALIDGSLKPRDLPEAWNAAVKRDLGLDVPSDRLGCLQDVHWSSGQIGTFCNYTIGNVMAGQLFEAAQADGEVAAGLERADYEPLRRFMGEHVHRHGRRYGRDELLRRATGRALDPEPYLRHLSAKYRELYALGDAA